MPRGPGGVGIDGSDQRFSLTADRGQSGLVLSTDGSAVCARSVEAAVNASTDGGAVSARSMEVRMVGREQPLQAGGGQS